MKTKNFFILFTLGLLVSISVKVVRDALSFDIKNAYSTVNFVWIWRNGTETMAAVEQYNDTETHFPNEWSAELNAKVKSYVNVGGSASSTDLNNCSIIFNYCKPRTDYFCLIDDTGMFLVKPNGEHVRMQE